MFKNFTLTLASLALATSMTHAAEQFSLSYNFDSEADFANGWSYADAGLLHETSEYFGAPATDNPSNMVLGKGTANMQEVIYTPMLKLTAGEPCTIEFDYWAPGISPELINHVGLNVAATTEQSASGTSVDVGSVATMKAYETWTHFSFSFTPGTDGEYCFALKTVNSYNRTSGCGGFCIDNVAIAGTGEGLSQGGETPDPGTDPGTDPEPELPTGKEAFTLDFNFDNEADYADGTIIAPGWSFSGGIFQRGKASDFGRTAHSGEYILGKATVSFNEVLYTPMVELIAGEPCTIEFYFMAPGGTPAMVRNVGLKVNAGKSQSIDDQTIEVGTVENAQYSDWTKQTFTFTPETSGEYCFSLKTFNPSFSSSCGGAFIDDVTISGYNPVYGGEVPEGPTVDDLEPNEDNLADCMELPYIENFSDASHYDGTSYLPTGWHSTGTVVWRTANMNALPAADGEYYMIVDHSSFERDENAYTPFFNLEADRTYTITFKTFVQGNENDGDPLIPTLRFTVGTEQDADFHATLLTINKRSSGWIEHTVSFTPRLAGAYTFAFMLSGPSGSGVVAVDNLVITSEGLIATAVPAFSVIGLFDIFDNVMTVDSETPVQFVNRSQYAETYEWKIAGAVPETSTDENPLFAFPASGNYTVEMTASNARGSRSTSRTYSVKVVEDGGNYAFSIYNEGEDKYYDRGAVPAFYTDADDYVTGYNHYYRTLAQRFEFPAKEELSVTQLTCWISDRRYANATGNNASQNTTPFNLVIYGANEDGSIDTENELCRKTCTVGEALGSSGLGSIAAANQAIVLDEPVIVKGTIYVSFEFSDQLLVDAIDPNLGRSYISTTAVRHNHGRTTLYAKPYNVPEESDALVGEWCSVDRLDSSMAGIGADWILWANSKEASSIAFTPSGDAVFAATGTAEGNILVSGTRAGSTVRVFDAQGRLLLSAPAAEGSTTLNAASLGRGLFIVSCPEGSAKIVK